MTHTADKNGASATIIADSMAPSGIRLTTMLVTYANIIKQDLWTHRSVSKNTSIDDSYNLDVSRSSNSNRAIPTKKIIREVLRNPFCPARFPKRSVSMHSAQGYHTGITAFAMRHIWLKLRYIMILAALTLQWLGCHKQIANRLLDQWQYTTAVFTATDEWWQHFFTLRNHYAAQDQVQDIAQCAHNVYNISEPRPVSVGGWHLPFVDPRSFEDYLPNSVESTFEALILCWIKLSVARCARLSYTSDRLLRYPFQDDFDLHDRLVIQSPEHAGPREHQAMAVANPDYRSGNLRGWTQLRHSELGAAMKRRAIAEAEGVRTNTTEPTWTVKLDR
jgi:Fe-S-cluster formation regulator IscX/YfhJ